MTIRELKKGDLFTLKPIDEPKASQVWVRGEYDRSTKRYSVTSWDDVNRERFLKGSHEAFTEFTF